MIMSTSATKSTGPSSTKKGTSSRSKSCSSIAKNSTGKRRILGELPCDPHQKPERTLRRKKSAKKALEFNKEDQCGIEFEKDDTALKSILSGSGIQPQLCHNAVFRQTFAGSSCKNNPHSTTPGRVSMYYEPSKSDRMSIFDKWTAYKSRHLSKTDTSESTGTEISVTQPHVNTEVEFKKDTAALKSILSEAGLQPMTDRKAEARQTFAGIASEFKPSGIPIPRNSAVRQTITGSSSVKKTQNGINSNKNPTVRASLADAKVKKNTTPTKSLASRKLAAKVTLNGTPTTSSISAARLANIGSASRVNQNTTPTTAPNSAARLASIGSATRVNQNTTPLSQNPVSRRKCEGSINKQDMTPARRVICPAFTSPAPQRQETPASIQKHKKGVTWADELNSPRRIIKKEKLSKVLFLALDENAGIEEDKENQLPNEDDDGDRRRLQQQQQQQQKLAGKVLKKIVDIKSADNRESLSSRNNSEVSYNNDVTICYNETTDRNESSSLLSVKQPCAESTNANIDKDADDVDGTSSYSPSFTPISNNTALHRLLSMSHASESNTTVTSSTTNAVVQSLDSAVVCTINDCRTQLIESATLSKGVKQAKEAFKSTSILKHGQSLNNYNFTDSGSSDSHSDSQNKNFFPFTGSNQHYMGNGKFCTSLQNSTVAKTSEEQQTGHYGTFSTLHTNKPNVSPKDNLESNHNKERAHSEENHAGAKAGVSSSRDVTHAVKRNNNHKDEDVETFKGEPVSELHPREIILTKTMAMHTEEVEDDQQDNSKSKTETSMRRETVDKFVGRVKKNKKRQSIAELNETLNELKVHFQILQSKISTLVESRSSEHVSDNIDDNGNDGVSFPAPVSASSSQNANIMYQLSLIQKQQDQLQILQRQLQEQLQRELKQNTSETSEDTQQQSTLGESVCQETANLQKQCLENTVTTSSQQGVGLAMEGGRQVEERVKSEIHDNLEEEECNNNGATAINLNNVKKEGISESCVSTVKESELLSVVPIQENSKSSLERSVSTPPSKISQVSVVHEPLDLTPKAPSRFDLTSVVPSRSQDISGFSSSVDTMFSQTLTQSRNGSPANIHGTPPIDVSSVFSVTSKQQGFSSHLTPVTTVQSNMGSLVSPKVIKLEPSSQSRLSANIYVSRLPEPPIWTPLALKVAAVSAEESIDQSKQTAICSEKEELSSTISSIPSNENTALDLSGPVIVTNVKTSGTKTSSDNEFKRYSASPQTSNQSAFRTVSGSTMMTQSGSLSLRANVTPLDLSPRKQKEKPAPLRKIVLLVTSERYQEALLDDECALYACRLQSFTRLPSPRDLINPVARMLSEGDDMHFVPITEDISHRYGFREGSAFHSYSP